MRVDSPIPLYHRVYTVLRQRVLNGDYPPGTQLAPEDELAAEFGVSRATIRQAVGRLVATDMVSRRQGRGTFVLGEPGERLGQGFTGNLGDLIREGRRTKVKNVSIDHNVEVPARIAQALQLDGFSATRLQRTRYLDGAAFGYTIDYFTPDAGQALNRAKLTSAIPRDLLAEQGHVITGATQTIRAQLADLAVSDALAIPLGSAVLFVERVTVGEEGRPLVFVQSWYRGDMYEFKAFLEPENGELYSQLA